MMEHVKRFQTPLLTGAGVVVFAIVLFMALISPQGSKLSKLHAQQSDLQTKQSQLQAQIATLKRDKAQMAKNCAALAKALDEIPGTPSVDSFLQQVTALAVASGDPNTPTISVTQASGPGAPAVAAGSQAAAAPAVAGAIPVQVSLTLDGTYGQMTAFLKGLDSFPRLFTVTAVKVAGGPIASGGGQVAPGTGGFTLTLTGAVYYATSHQPACGASTASQVSASS